MGEITLGQIVHSKAGRDKGRYFMVIGIVDSEYVLLSDGDLRKITNPKKKKIKHLKFHDSIASQIKERLEDGKKILDADIRKCLQSMNLL